nr:Chain B, BACTERIOPHAGE T4 SHORT TAIL FIBRE [Tequatrovirus T4]
SLNYIIKVKE